jgi:hypothetical protein
MSTIPSKVSTSLLLIYCLSVIAFGQSPQRKAQPKKAPAKAPVESKETSPQRKIEGVLAAISGGGDVLYARQTPVRLIKADIPNRELNLRGLAMKSYLDGELEALKANKSEKLAKVDGVEAIEKMASKLIRQLAEEEGIFKDGPRYYLGKTNLAGQFSFEVPPGKYYLYCLGNAGLNLAVWVELVDVTQENQSNLELAKPLFSVLTVP